MKSPTEVRPLDRLITDFASSCGYEIQTVFNDLAFVVYYILEMLKVQERVSSKFVKYLREELYEIRAEYGGNIWYSSYLMTGTS